MIKSRRRFLDLGYYNRVSDGINEAIANNLERVRAETALSVFLMQDAVRVFISNASRSLWLAGQERKVPIDYYGVDISKFAVRQATNAIRQLHWFVASIVDLPFAPSSFAVVLNVFSLAYFC